MSPTLIFIVFLSYTLMLFLVSALTARDGGNKAFFLGNKKSPWPAVAYGMIGASLSGVTFISVPGWVSTTQFSYLMVVAGYLVGYAIIAFVLLPVYYRLNLTSIYTYLEGRFGFWSYKTGASYFLISRIVGSSFRMFLAVAVLQTFLFDKWNIPFEATAILTVLIILGYTFRSGIRTIVWTDTLQTTFMLSSLIISIVLIIRNMDISFGELVHRVVEAGHAKVVFAGDLSDKRDFLKQFLGGAFIAITMTGLDQDMMQKNLSCRNLKDAQKNVITLSWILVPVNLLFLFLGASILVYAATMGIELPANSDYNFPFMAFNHFGALAGIVFLIGLIAANYASADSALAALTTSFAIDIYGLERRQGLDEKRKESIRKRVHIGMALFLGLMIVVFKYINNQAVIQQLFTIAGYTYGPLLGLYAYGLFTKRPVIDRWVPLVAILSPAICFVLQYFSKELFNGYVFGFELLVLNGALTFLGLWILSLLRKPDQESIT
jgi:solute:Na+ symporter, SSS family